MATKSLYEIKQDKFRKKNPNTISDADYRLRDKEAEGLKGYPNSLDITPEDAKPKAKKATSKEA